MAPRRAIVVGSGPAGVWAARGLLDRGFAVTVFDGGQRAQVEVPSESWDRLRREDPGQSAWLLGDDFEALRQARRGVAAQLTPPRLSTLDPRDVGIGFSTVLGRGRGGLGVSWGALSSPWDARDLAGTALAGVGLEAWCAAVGREIGIAGAPDDLSPWLGDGTLPAAPVDSHYTGLLERYRVRRDQLNRRGLYLGVPRLALRTRPGDGRPAHPGDDLDFYRTGPDPVWRPGPMLRALEGRGLQLRSERASHFVEADGAVRLVTEDGASCAADALILAASPIGSGALALRSHRGRTSLPLLAKPMSHVVALNVAALGRTRQPQRHSLAQLVAISARSVAETPSVLAEVHGYRTLMLWRLLQQAPLPIRGGVTLLRELRDALVLLNLFSPAQVPAARLELGAGGVRVVGSGPDDGVRRHRAEWALVRHLPALGCVPLLRLPGAPGASLHTGGSLPAALEERPLTTDPAGRLRPWRRVFVADASAFPALPAKPPTLAIMANGLRIASGLPV